MAYATYQPEVQCVTADKTLQLNHSDPETFCEVYESGECLQLQFKAPFKTIIEQWNLICNLDYVPQLTNSIQISGEIIGLLVSGPLSDAFGRKRMVIIIYPLFLIATVTSAFATNWKFFALLRFFVGGLLISNVSIWGIWAMEITEEWYNVIMNLAGSWQFAYMVTALIAYLSYQWNTYLLILGLIGIVPLLFAVLIFVESPRWQVQKGQLEKASESLSTITSYQVSAHQLSKIPCETHDEANLYCISLFSTKNLAIYTIVLCLGVLATAVSINAYVFQVTKFSGSPFIKFLLYGGLRIIIPISIYFCDQYEYMHRFGRRHMFLIPMGLIFIFYFLLIVRNIFFPDFIQNSMFYYMLGSAVIANFLSVATDQFTVELYPTVMRNTAYTFTQLFYPFGSVFLPQLVYLEKYWPNILTYVVLVVALVTFVSVFLVLPETKGKDLPETIDSVPEPWYRGEGDGEEIE